MATVKPQEPLKGAKNLPSKLPKPQMSIVEKDTKAPQRKYGAHTGIKFNFNVQKGQVIKPFIFEVGTEDKKEISSTISRKTDLKQTNKKEYGDSGDREETFTQDLRFSKALDKADNTTQPTRSALDSKISSGNENSALCSNVAKSLRQLSLNPKVVKSQVSNTMKPQPMPQSSNTSQVPILATVKPQEPFKGAKDLPAKLLKPQTSIDEMDMKKSRNKYGAHVGLKFPSIGKKETVVCPFRFASSSPSSSRKCSNSEGKQSESKDMSTPEGSRQKK